MKSEELDRLETRIGLVKKLLKEREMKPQDFATSLTVMSLRSHLKDIENQREKLVAELSLLASDRGVPTRSQT